VNNLVEQTTNLRIIAGNLSVEESNRREAGNAMHLLLDLLASIINGFAGRLQIFARVLLHAAPRVAAGTDGKHE
jgi:hypothetical protein